MHSALFLGVFLFLTADRSVCAQAHIDISFAAAKPSQIEKAHRRLAKWLKAKTKREFGPKIKRMVRNRQIFLAQHGDLDLRDAVAALPAGARSPERPVCATLELCPAPLDFAHADSALDLPDAIASLLRPWLVLQHRRSGRVAIDLTAQDSEVLLNLTLEGLVQGPIKVQVSPDTTAGFQVWLGRASDLGRIYSFSREALLSPSKFSDFDLAPIQ